MKTFHAQNFTHLPLECLSFNIIVSNEFDDLLLRFATISKNER